MRGLLILSEPTVRGTTLTAMRLELAGRRGGRRDSLLEYTRDLTVMKTNNTTLQAWIRQFRTHDNNCCAYTRLITGTQSNHISVSLERADNQPHRPQGVVVAPELHKREFFRRLSHLPQIDKIHFPSGRAAERLVIAELCFRDNSVRLHHVI